MIRQIPVTQNGLTWIDVVNPTREELGLLAIEHGLHRTSVEDCLDPEHLPKYERIGDTTFVILRAIDEAAPPDASGVQEVTRKISIFYRPDLFLTVRRVDQPFFAAMLEARGALPERRTTEDTASSLLAVVTHAVLATYGPPLEELEDVIERFEESVFDRSGPAPLETIYLQKRRVTLIRRVLFKTQGVIHQFVAPAERAVPLFQDLRESAEAWHFYADQLIEELNNLLAVHLSVASHRTNEVMRVLTVFSAFFLPLTFVVGIYGMNFAHMPELASRYGYPLVLVAMVLVSAGIAWWFHHRGWLGRSR